MYKLFKVVLENSVSKEWVVARDEWFFEYVYFVSFVNAQTCVCGHHPILEICTIKNKFNGRKLEIGNCCVKKFMKDEWDFFNVLRRVKRDLSKSVGSYVLARALVDGVISSNDGKFYSDTVHKRVLSDKQMRWRKDINIRIVERYFK